MARWPTDRSDEQEVDQRSQGGGDAGAHQGIVGAEIVLRVQGGLDLLAHG